MSLGTTSGLDHSSASRDASRPMPAHVPSTPEARPDAPLKLRGSLPSARTIATISGVVVTAVLMLELGIWYLVALVVIYAALDLVQRAETRRDARLRIAILNSVGQTARCLRFVGP